MLQSVLFFVCTVVLCLYRRFSSLQTPKMFAKEHSGREQDRWALNFTHGEVLTSRDEVRCLVHERGSEHPKAPGRSLHDPSNLLRPLNVKEALA